MLRKYLTTCLLLVTLIIPAVLSAQSAPKADTTGKTANTEDEQSGYGAGSNAPALRGGFGNGPASVGNGAGYAAPRGSFRGSVQTLTTGTGLGATVGGAKDIGYARQLIKAGQIPASVDFSPEGLYAEHDIPTPAGDCNARLCLSLGYGYAPTADDSSNALLVHLGMSSNVKPDEFKRPALQLMVVVDRSGSMSGGSMEAVKTALKKLVSNLRNGDELGLVAFDDKAVVLLAKVQIGVKGYDAFVKDQVVIKAIESLTADNGTNIEAGLQLGYAQLEKWEPRPGANKRLMLFTDEQPNIGRTDSASFVGMILGGSKQHNIGFTLFGIGFHFGQELAYQTSQARGANFFFLESPAKIAKVFDKEFDYLVTPVVYDLKVTIATPAGLKLKAVYGLPSWKPGDRDAHLEIPTVFFSSDRGAIILRYENADTAQPVRLAEGDQVVNGTISYADAGDGTRRTFETHVRHNGRVSLAPGTLFFTHDGMRVAAALTNVYFGLRDGCRLYADGKKQQALEAIERARMLALADNLAAGDASVTDEINLLAALSANIEKADSSAKKPVGLRSPAGE